MIKTTSDFRAAIELCGLVVEAAHAGDIPAVGATLARLQELLEHEPAAEKRNG